MLLFIIDKPCLLMNSHNYLNTSHVTVYPVLLHMAKVHQLDLNTSHVTVYLIGQGENTV